MKIHLLSGFLGSGKTTALANAAVDLMQRGYRVGVITNDQGKYQVDSQFVNSKGVPVVEVSNGCFCCNYDNLDAHIISLEKQQAPHYIFAESVGSCTDIIATVLKPLLNYRSDLFETISLSTFADARLMELYLRQKRLPFSEEVNYIIEKQYEEADLLIINKIDLLDLADLTGLRERVHQQFPGKEILFQSAHELSDVRNWVRQADRVQSQLERPSMQVDYQKYGAGEAQLAWLDQQLIISGPMAGRQTERLVQTIHQRILAQNLPIGHLKFIVSDRQQSSKWSFTQFDHSIDAAPIISPDSTEVRLLINARIECSPETLQNLVQACIDHLMEQQQLQLNLISQDFFAPGVPQPTHHFS